MFYKDNNDIQAIQFGVGDVMVAGITVMDDDGTPSDDVVGIAFGDQDEREIGSISNDLTGKTDIEANVKLKMIFDSPDSIQVVIDRLLLMQDELSR